MSEPAWGALSASGRERGLRAGPSRPVMIVDFTRSPAIDTTAFPGAQGGFHKTASDWILTTRKRG